MELQHSRPLQGGINAATRCQTKAHSLPSDLATMDIRHTSAWHIITLTRDGWTMATMGRILSRTGCRYRNHRRPFEGVRAMSDFTRWRCKDCNHITPSHAILRTTNPFDASDTISGCPNCRQVESFELICDEPGCDSLARCGWPTKNGYRQTCFRHAKSTPIQEI